MHEWYVNMIEYDDGVCYFRHVVCDKSHSWYCINNMAALIELIDCLPVVEGARMVYNYCFGQGEIYT